MMNNSFLELNELTLSNINGGIGDLSFDLGSWLGSMAHNTHDQMVKSAGNIMANHTTIRR